MVLLFFSILWKLQEFSQSSLIRRILIKKLCYVKVLDTKSFHFTLCIISVLQFIWCSISSLKNFNWHLFPLRCTHVAPWPLKWEEVVDVWTISLEDQLNHGRKPMGKMNFTLYFVVKSVVMWNQYATQFDTEFLFSLHLLNSLIIHIEDTMSVWKSEEKSLIFACLISHSKIIFPSNGEPGPRLVRTLTYHLL